MTNDYIRARIIRLEERKEQCLKNNCPLVARRLQKEIDELNKELCKEKP